MRGSPENFVEKTHWTRRVGERDQSARVHCRHEQAGGDPNRLDRVISGRTCSIGQSAERLRENRDQPRRGFEKRFVRIGPERGKRFQPRFRRAVFIELFFFFLRCDPDLAFDRRIAHRHEMPRLQVRAARRCPGRTDAILNHFARHRPIGIIADRPPPSHRLVKLARTFENLIIRKRLDLRCRHKSWR